MQLRCLVQQFCWRKIQDFSQQSTKQIKLCVKLKSEIRYAQVSFDWCARKAGHHDRSAPSCSSLFCTVQGRAIAEQAVVDLEQQDEMRLQRSVEAGLANAQARVLPESSNGTSTSSSATNIDTADSTSENSNAQPSSNANDHGQQRLHGEDHDDSSSGSSPERAKGSQLSAAEKQKSAVKSVS